MRMPQLRQDLQQIRADGFNGIIAVVPWRGFQSSQFPVAYDSFYEQQLRLLLHEARRARLRVVLRVAYTHLLLPGPVENGIRQAQRLLTEPAVEAAWLDYHRKLHAVIRGHAGYIAAFVSWEELWHAFANWQTQEHEERRWLTRECGYADYLRANGITDHDCIPERQDPAYVHYHRFINQRIADLFARARSRMPELGVEARIDRDPLHSDGETIWLENDRFYDLEPARYSYWAPFFGAENQGEAIDVDAAIDSLGSMLRENSRDGELTGQVLEQFNFIDDTLRYAGVHAKLRREGIGEFLQRAAELLRRYSGGYGLWAWRSYRSNVLYNAALLDSGRGWLTSGERRFAPEGGCTLLSGESLTQQLFPKVAGIPRAHPIDHLSLRLQCSSPGVHVRARLNRGPWADCKNAAAEWDLVLDFESVFREGLLFELEVLEGSLELQRLFLFSQVYDGAVRDVDGEPDVYLADIQALNRRLP